MEEKKDEVLLAELDVKQRIQQVMSEKNDLLKNAKEKAQRQLKTYDDELLNKTQEKISQLIINREANDHIEQKTKSDIELIKQLFKKNKENVTQFLFNTVTNVDIHIPDVVIGNFEEKFNEKK